MKRTALAVIIILLLLASAMVGVPRFKIASANPFGIWSPPESAILSPSQNETYRSNVPLTLKITLYAKGYYPEMLTNLSYSLDRKPDISLSFHSDYGGPKTTIFVSDVLCGLTDGEHTLLVHGLTEWGNTFNSIVTFGVDTTTPVVSITSPQNVAYDGNDVPLTFTIEKPTSLDRPISLDGSVPTFAKVLWIRYSLDGQNNLTIHGNTTLTGLSNGAHNITIYAKDTYGNTGASQTVFFTTKTAPFPTLTVATVSGVSATIVVSAALVVYFKKRKKNN